MTNPFRELKDMMNESMRNIKETRATIAKCSQDIRAMTKNIQEMINNNKLGETTMTKATEIQLTNINTDAKGNLIAHLTAHGVEDIVYLEQTDFDTDAGTIFVSYDTIFGMDNTMLTWVADDIKQGLVKAGVNLNHKLVIKNKGDLIEFKATTEA